MEALRTLVAVATAPGHAGVGVVRVSGPLAHAVAAGVLGRVPAPRQAVFAAFCDAAGGEIDRGVALWFAAPASYTGEDTLELQAHGNPLALAALVRRCVELGAEPARPGEFTERAFLNGKLSLDQAEAVPIWSLPTPKRRWPPPVDHWPASSRRPSMRWPTSCWP